MNFQQYLKQVKSEIREVSVDEVNAKRPPVLIDVREGDEYNDGYIPGATANSYSNTQGGVAVAGLIGNGDYYTWSGSTGSVSNTSW